MNCVLDTVNADRPAFGKCTLGGLRDIVLGLLAENGVDLVYPSIVNCTGMDLSW